MFTKQDIETMMADHDGSNFLIKTNNANGYGINGTDYDRFFSYAKKECRSGVNDEELTITTNKVVKVTDTSLVLSRCVTNYIEYHYGHTVSKGKETIKKSTIYLPLDVICAIEFQEN